MHTPQEILRTSNRLLPQRKISGLNSTWRFSVWCFTRAVSTDCRAKPGVVALLMLVCVKGSCCVATDVCHWRLTIQQGCLIVANTMGNANNNNNNNNSHQAKLLCLLLNIPPACVCVCVWLTARVCLPVFYSDITASFLSAVLAYGRGHCDWLPCASLFN